MRDFVSDIFSHHPMHQQVISVPEPPKIQASEEIYEGIYREELMEILRAPRIEAQYEHQFGE